MVYINLKEHLIYYLNEPDKKLRDRFYSNFLYEILNNYFSFALKKLGISENNGQYFDLRQELHIHILRNLVKISEAKDSNAYIIVISKNYILKFIECQTKNSIRLQPGEICELINSN